MQGDLLNGYGELYIKRHPQLKTKIVDGSSLVVAIVLNSIPKETNHVFLCGRLDKVSYAIVNALCEKGTKVCLILFINVSNFNSSFKERNSNRI
jgi:aldehyde decarbonylase